MAFKNTLTNSQNNWKASDAYNNSYREREDVQTLNKVTMTQNASLATRVQAMRLEINKPDKNTGNSSFKGNERINPSIRSPISVETELLQYKKHERDSSSDSSLQILSSDNSASATSTRHTTPVDNLDSKFNYVPSPPNTGTKTSFSKNNEEAQVFMIKLEKQQQQHKEEIEKLRKEHRIQLNKTESDYEKSKNVQKQEFEKIIQELKNGNRELVNQNKNESQKKELVRLDVEKKMKILKERTEDELKKTRNNFRQKYDEEIRKLRSEHASQLDSMKRGETKVLFEQIRTQQERKEMELQNQIKRGLDEKEASEKRKDAQIAGLREENIRLSQDLNRNKNMIKEFKQKIEEQMREQLNAKKKAEMESEKLREQLNNTSKEFDETKEHCEDLESLIKDKTDIINRLQLQLERMDTKRNELDTQNFKEFKERREKEHEQAMELLRKDLEASHRKELQELRNRLEKEYEIGQNSRTEQNNEATHRLANAESSYTELNAKHQQLIRKNQQLLDEIASIRSKVENLDDLKDNNRLITSEKEKIAEELKKAKDEIRRLRNEDSTTSDKIIELENERDKLASSVSATKTYWEKNYKDLQIRFEEVESQRNKLDNELTKAKSNHSEKIKAFEELTNNIETVEKQKESLSKMVEEHRTCMNAYMNESAAEREAWSQREADLVSNYELELREKDSELEGLRNELDNTRKHSKELEELLLEAQEAETKQLDLSQKLEAALRECINKDNEISNLEMFKKQSQARIDSLESSTNRLTMKLRGFEADTEQARRNADAKINELQDRLKRSMTEIEDLHSQISSLKQNLIEKEAIVLSHSRSSSRDGPRSPTYDTSKLTNLTMQVEEYKVTHQNLEAQIATLNQKLQEAHQEKNTLMTTFEQSIAQAEKNVEELHNKMKTMEIEHEEKIQKLKKQHENEISGITEFTQSRLAALEKRQLNAKKVNTLEPQLLELENSLKESRSECDKLNEKIIHVQQRYADSISEKDKAVKEKNERIESLQEELQAVLTKNMDLVTSISNYNKIS